MKIVIAIDSFKGSLTSLQAGNAVKDAINRLDDKHQVLVKPLADGGGDIADPWYSGDFETTYCDVVRGCEALIKKLNNQY